MNMFINVSQKYFCFINILGPESEAWGGLCITGSKQSPINIRHHEIVDHWDPLHYGKYPHTIHIENNGHTAKVTVELEDGCHKKPQVIGGELPGKFELAQFHFHWGSKHSRGSEHNLRGHSGSSLAIIIFFFHFFFVLYINFNISNDVFEEKINIFHIKWGKLVHREV
jgi:hypothetical protein